MRTGSLPHLLFAGLLCVVVCGMSALRASPNTPPEAVLQQAVDEVIAAAFTKDSIEPAARAARIRPVLDRVMDFPTITRRAIGPAWSQLGADEQQGAITAFSALVVRTYVAHLEGEDRPQVAYDPPSKSEPDRCEISTRVTYAGRMFRVSYRLQQLPEGWRVYDIIIEGVSFISNYRAQFAAVAQKGGGKAVLQALEAKKR